MILFRMLVSLSLMIGLTLSFGSQSFGDETLESFIQMQTETYRKLRPFGALSIAVIDHDQEQYFNFGSAGQAGELRPVSEKSIYEIGSCTKVFTALVLAVAVQNGEVALHQTLKDCFPEARLSEDAQKVTLQELAVHTSGLPRLPAEMWTHPQLDLSDPYVHLTQQDLLKELESWQRPAEVHQEYSNLGFGILGTALAQLEGSGSCEELVHREILKPLAMNSTDFQLPSDRTRLVRGFSKTGELQQNWNFQAMAGAGALKSDAEDMVKFLKAQIDPQRFPVPAAIRLTHQNQFSSPQPEMGLGWFVGEIDSERFYVHNGGTAGYRSIMAVCPSRKVGVVLLSNTGDAMVGDDSLDQIGRDILRRLALTPTQPSAD